MFHIDDIPSGAGEGTMDPKKAKVVILRIMELLWSYPFKCQTHKMVKHTQKIRRQNADELFECV